MARRTPPSPSSSAEPALGELFMQTARSLRRRSVRALEPWGVTPHEVRTLRVVGEHEPTRLGVVAQHLRIAPRSVTDVVDALEERGYVARAADPEDRRATRVTTTASGRALVAELDDARRADADDFFGRLSQRDQAALARILRRLAEDG